MCSFLTSPGLGGGTPRASTAEWLRSLQHNLNKLVRAGYERRGAAGTERPEQAATQLELGVSVRGEQTVISMALKTSSSPSPALSAADPDAARFCGTVSLKSLRESALTGEHMSWQSRAKAEPGCLLTRTRSSTHTPDATTTNSGSCAQIATGRVILRRSLDARVLVLGPAGPSTGLRTAPCAAQRLAAPGGPVNHRATM